MIRISNCKDFDLVQAWKAHRKADRLQGLPAASANMLLFYAAECGLKHLLLEQRALRTCPDGKGWFHSHDLAAILREMSPAAADVGAAPSNLELALGSGKMRHNQPADVHAAWRYGLPINPENEQEIVRWLRQVNAYIAQKRRQP